MQYDPIQAFFSGLTSTFARVILITLAFFLAFSTYFLSQGGSNFSLLATAPLVAFAIIFAWGAKGLLFFIGLISIVLFLYTAWRFLDTAHPKGLFLILYILAFIYFIPLMWDPDVSVWKGVAGGGAFLSVYIFIAYVLPAVASSLLSRNAA